MKLVLTGGHLAPALSVIDILPKDTKVLFVGRKHALEGDKAISLEYKTINFLNIPFASISAGRFQRKLTRHTLFSLLKLPFGIIQSFLILRNFKPDAVLGFGGYVSIPVAICAFLMGIPVVIHEQTLEAGFSNRIISIFAKKVCISWDSSRKFFPKKKTIFTGNPIRKFKTSNIKSQAVKKDKNLPTIYITGGSSGSHFINELIKGSIKDLLEKFNVVHQTGDSQEFRDYDKLKEIRDSLSPELSEKYTLEKFIEPSEVGSILKTCDVVISRSGINTITELLDFEKPSLLIPLPYSQNSEQLKNALFLEKLGLGKVLLQKEADSKKLLQAVVLIVNNIKNYKIDKSKINNILIQNAEKNIVEVVENVIKKEKS